MPYPLTKIRGRTAALLTFLLLSGCQAIIPAQVAEPSPIESIADAYVDALLERYPSMATAYDLPGWRHDDLCVPLGQVLGIFLRFVPILPEWPLRAYSESIELPLRLPCGELAHAFKRECRPTAEPAILILVAMALSAKPSPPLSTLTF